ncbi:MAG: PIG-L family deacetylase [Candidatus Dormibacteria bacterium]
MTTLLLVHAHPDDESILTGGVIALAQRDGHRVVLVTATLGENGHSPSMHDGDSAAALAEVRRQELEAACVVLGVHRLELLGYRGSPFEVDSAAPAPDHFRGAPVRDVAERLVSVLHEEHPDVVVTYGADGTYGHPDHVKAHHVTVAALDVLAEQGWAPAKLYLHALPRSLVRVVVEAALNAGIDFPQSLVHTPGTPDEEMTTVVDVSPVLDRKLAACVEHRSQMQAGLPLAAMAAGVFETTFGVEHFVLARGDGGEWRPETSLFSGLS